MDLPLSDFRQMSVAEFDTAKLLNHASRQAEERVARITSALLTWAVLILVPLTVVIALAAGPVASFLNPVNPNASCPHPQMISDTARLLVAFAPQVFLYGVSVVLFGLLQAYRRFTGPALAPVIANVVLISCYLAFIPADGGRGFLATPAAAMLLLGLGTTANIAALVLVPAVPAWRLRLKIRPALKFPPGVARQAGGLVLVGLIEFVAQDVLNVVVIAVANGHGDTGALVLANYQMQVFNAMYGVLAVSIVTSVFPVLSSREGKAFDRVSAGSTRAVLLVSWLGTALIAAIAVPAAHVLARQGDQVPQLVWAFALAASTIDRPRVRRIVLMIFVLMCYFLSFLAVHRTDGRMAGRMSFELEGSAAYNLAVDQDVHAIGADSERARFQIVDVLTAGNSEV